MMASNKAGAELGFALQPVADVVGSIVEGIEADAFEVVRGGEARAAMLELNRTTRRDGRALPRAQAEPRSRRPRPQRPLRRSRHVRFVQPVRPRPRALATASSSRHVPIFGR
jgi:hypothetical protein